MNWLTGQGGRSRGNATQDALKKDEALVAFVIADDQDEPILALVGEERISIDVIRQT